MWDIKSCRRWEDKETRILQLGRNYSAGRNKNGTYAPMQISDMVIEVEKITCMYNSGERLSISFWDPGNQIWKLFSLPSGKGLKSGLLMTWWTFVTVCDCSALLNTFSMSIKLLPVSPASPGDRPQGESWNWASHWCTEIHIWDLGSTKKEGDPELSLPTLVRRVAQRSGSGARSMTELVKFLPYKCEDLSLNV